MSILDDIENIAHAVEATAEEIATRLATIGDWGTAGPAPDDHPPVTPAIAHPAFVDGWWSGAKRIDACAGRIGGVIDPCCVVDHTTDMHPDDWPGLVKAWCERAGDGACIQLLAGRDEAHGVLQFMSILRNGNHAGGPTHGVYIDAAGHRWHPNLLAVGIEFHCAGGQLRQLGGVWRFVENGVAHGAPIPASDVEPDPQRPGRGWHKLTPYQESVRARLHADLDAALRPMPAGMRAVSTGEGVPMWGVAKSSRFVGHVSLDPTSRSDPWPNGMRALR